ncbi:MAG: hypothetical protein J7518_04715 [Nocardioidaceae bacterium]|nr:hypothetical protein [Nocardioidaceae bacterium]
MRRVTRRGAVALSLALAVGAGALSGCGTDRVVSASEQVPALSTTLDRVDAAVAAHRYDAARRQLRSLIAATTAAREDGRLDDDRANGILAAAARLLAALPAVKVTPTPTPTPTPKAAPKPKPKPAPRQEHGDEKHHGGHGHD